MNEDELIAAVTAIALRYGSQGKINERFYTFFQQGAQRMKTVLLVGHGSRVTEGNDELRKFTSELAARKPELTFVTCFIELASPSIAEGIALCVKGGASTVYVVPIILFAAGHSKLDIPLAMDQAKLKYPGVEFVYGRPVGVQERAVDILLDRIAEATAWRQPDQPEDKMLTSGGMRMTRVRG